MPRGVKWRGKSVNQVLDRLREAGETTRALYLMKKATDERVSRLEREAKEKLIELADELKGLTPNDLSLGHSWDCEGSPTDHCIYNTWKDAWKDHCLFCGDPLDRG